MKTIQELSHAFIAGFGVGILVQDIINKRAL